MAVVRELTRGRMLGTLVAAGAVAAFTIGVAPAVGASVTKPGPPTGVKVAPGNGYAVIAWNAPTSNGESPITGYTAQAMPRWQDLFNNRREDLQDPWPDQWRVLLFVRP